MIMEKASEASAALCMVFSRTRLYEGVRDSVRHDKLWNVVKRMSLNDSTVDTLRSLYKDQEVAFRVGSKTGSRLVNVFDENALISPL